MDTKRKVSVILNGQIPINNTLINQINNSDYIIAVDGSANKLFDLEIIPDVIIGDLDSFQNISDKNIELVETPDQNKTDFRKTLEWCIEKNILDTFIGENGSKLSGGQLQRLSLLRAFLSEKQIIFFDEATSALDKENERKVIELIFYNNFLTSNKILIFSTHSKEIANECDHVIDIEKLNLKN